MPSKWRAYLHLSQEKLDTLAKIDPTINDCSTIHEVAKKLFDDIINGMYVRRDKAKIEIALREEKLRQEILRLKIKNKISLIHDIHANPETAHQIVEEKIPVEVVIGQPWESPFKKVNAVSPYDDKHKIFNCNDCGIIFQIESFDKTYLKELQFKILSHIQEKHKRSCTPMEIDAFKKLGVPI